MEGFFEQLFDDEENSTLSLVIEDDGRVVYAYLLDDERIVGDVWLYNRGLPPVEAEWKKGPPTRPFTNPIEFVRQEDLPSFNPEKELSAKWTRDCNGAFLFVDLYIQKRLYARLSLGSKPGWSRLAKKDGPLAKRLEDSASEPCPET